MKKPEDNFWKHFKCWFSKRFWDLHDPLDFEANPSHFTTYKCPHCGKQCSL
jgi:hypothetical protein